MSKRILDYDPVTRTTTWHDYDPLTKVTTISKSQDVSHILERNKTLHRDDQYKRDGIKKEMWHVATIPLGIIEKWLREDGIDVFNKNHREAVKRKLMDRDNQYLRTSPGGF